MAETGGMEMPGWLNTLGGLVERAPKFWRWVGAVESSQHRESIDAVRVERPVYVAGVARSGSTVLLELLAGHPDTATHRYRDFPLLHAPIFWDKAFGKTAAGAAPAERAHKDRILVTPDSPEAMEEILWMGFFPRIHDPSAPHPLGRDASNPAFEAFYKDHVKKLLLVRGKAGPRAGGGKGQGGRYLSKGNYNLTRLGYISKIFPDARFVVPVREPRWHVASLVKQHRLFAAEEARDPRIRAHMRRVGHFEFGLGRLPVNAGEPAQSLAIAELWASGQDARGYARQWALAYGFVLDQLEADADLKARTRLVRYEDLCANPAAELKAALDHAELPLPDDKLEAAAARLAAPAYYSPGFSAEEDAAIAEETAEVAGKLGY